MKIKKIQLHAKNFGATAMHNGKIVGLAAAGMIGSQKFLDFEAIAQRIKPGMDTSGALFKHQGAIKLGGGIVALHMFGKKLPDWAKWLIIGVMVQGALQEANTLSGGKTGQIGNTINTTELDEQMRKAVEEIQNGMQGNNPTQNTYSSVAGVMDDFSTSVAGYLDTDNGVQVAGYETWN